MDQYSPKSSPRGSRSPNVAAAANAMDGNNPNHENLKFRIALGGQKPTIIQNSLIPFYLMKQEALPVSDITGATNLMASKGLEHSYNKLTSESSVFLLTSGIFQFSFFFSEKNERLVIFLFTQSPRCHRHQRCRRQ